MQGPRVASTKMSLQLHGTPPGGESTDYDDLKFDWERDEVDVDDQEYTLSRLSRGGSADLPVSSSPKSMLKEQRSVDLFSFLTHKYVMPCQMPPHVWLVPTVSPLSAIFRATTRTRIEASEEQQRSNPSLHDKVPHRALL